MRIRVAAIIGMIMLVISSALPVFPDNFTGSVFTENKKRRHSTVSVRYVE